MILTLLGILLNVHFAHATSLSDIEGRWRFREMIYRGERLPLQNPDLNLSWTFFKNGTDRLYWDRGTPEYCERFAQVSIEDNKIVEEVFALSPGNADDCSQDPDMQVGKKSSTQFKLVGKELQLTFPLGEETLTYVLKPESFKN